MRDQPLTICTAKRADETGVLAVADRPRGEELRWIVGDVVIFSIACPDAAALADQLVAVRCDLEALGWVFVSGPTH
jgi:hypothetical protein